jgi:hypothetical protein
MFLSRLLLNPASKEVQRDINDLYQLHRRLNTVFFDPAEDLGFTTRLCEFLFRVDISSHSK